MTCTGNTATRANSTSKCLLFLLLHGILIIIVTRSKPVKPMPIEGKNTCNYW